MHTVRTDGAKNMVIWLPQSQLNGDGANVGGAGVGSREKRGRKGLPALFPRREMEGGREGKRGYRLWA